MNRILLISLIIISCIAVFFKLQSDNRLLRATNAENQNNALQTEMIGRAKSEWSLCELGDMADIQKDISESFKNLIKVHVMTSEHSVEKY